MNQEEKLEFKSGVTSTKQTRLSLIPHRGLLNAAQRFELGLERHGAKAWNNLSPNQEGLKDEEWLIERCSHAIEHLYGLIDFLTHKKSNLEDAQGDAGAVAWCGLVLGEALVTKQPTQSKPEPKIEWQCNYCPYKTTNKTVLDLHEAACGLKKSLDQNKGAHQPFEYDPSKPKT